MLIGGGAGFTLNLNVFVCIDNWIGQKIGELLKQ
jgi:hypothetical protein